MAAATDPFHARAPTDADTVPVLDFGPYLAGESGAIEELSAELRAACEQIGFFFVVNHGIEPALVASLFEQARRFHALPLEAKQSLGANAHNIGYMPYRGSVSRASAVHENTAPNLNEALFIKRDLPSDHPDVIAGKRFRGMNQWPESLAGFRQTVVAYCDAMEVLGRRVIALYATALELPETYFDEAMLEPQYTLRLTHYPPVAPDRVLDNQFALAPHTDSSLITFLPQNDIPGLAIRGPTGEWIEPPALPSSFLVNTGDMMHRWTNHRFRSTPHRVVHTRAEDRYAIPFFFDCSIDYPMACLPTCQSPDDPPRYEPITYTEYMVWFTNQNYDHVRGGVP